MGSNRNEAFQGIGHGTNNIGELSAVPLGLRVISKHYGENAQGATIHIFTDSSYAKGCLSGEFHAKTNKRLIRSIKRELAHWSQNGWGIRWWKVPGHAKIEPNDAADELAKRGAAYAKNHALRNPAKPVFLTEARPQKTRRLTGKTRCRGTAKKTKTAKPEG